MRDIVLNQSLVLSGRSDDRAGSSSVAPVMFKPTAKLSSRSIEVQLKYDPRGSLMIGRQTRTLLGLKGISMISTGRVKKFKGLLGPGEKIETPLRSQLIN